MIVKKEDAFQHLVDEINKAAEVAAILVEGQKDRKALQQIGIKGDFYLIKQTHCSLEEIAERIAKKFKNVIFMFDNDPEGKNLQKKQKQIFGLIGVRVNNSFMLRLLRLCDTATVEGIPFLERKGLPTPKEL